MLLTFNEYQHFTGTTALYPTDRKEALAYLTLKLNGEAGEVAEKVGKYFRGDKSLDQHDLVLELGDVLWYISELATWLGEDLETVAHTNMTKLSARKANGTIKGEGDHR